MLKTKELRDLSETELLTKQESLNQELFKLNQQRYAGRVEKPHMFCSIKKDIARIKTILKEKAIKKNDK